MEKKSTMMLHENVTHAKTPHHLSQLPKVTEIKMICGCDSSEQKKAADPKIN